MGSGETIRTRRAFPRRIPDGVEGDGIDPGRELGGVGESPQGSTDLDEDLLAHIICPLAPEQPGRVGEDLAVVGLVDLRQVGERAILHGPFLLWANYPTVLPVHRDLRGKPGPVYSEHIRPSAGRSGLPLSGHGTYLPYPY